MEPVFQSIVKTCPEIPFQFLVQWSRLVGLLIVARHRYGLSDEDALDLSQADRIVGAVIELRRARRLVVGDLLTVFNCTTILE
jgi:hypothetical protein